MPVTGREKPELAVALRAVHVMSVKWMNYGATKLFVLSFDSGITDEELYIDSATEW